jgi:hypothetical protein
MRDLSVAAAGGVGAVDSTLTGVLGMVAVTELVDCLNMIKLWLRRSGRSRPATGRTRVVSCWLGWRQRS